MERERERFGGSSDLLSSLENVDLTRFKPRSLSKGDVIGPKVWRELMINKT